MKTRAATLGRFGLGLAVAFAANVIAGTLAPSAPSLLRFDVVYRPLLMLLLLIGFSVLLLAVDRVEENPLAAMGLGLSESWQRNVSRGLMLGAGMVAAGIGAIAVLGRFSPGAHLTAHTVAAAVAAVWVLASGAMAEELMFRGYPFQRLIDAIGGAGAVVVFSALFASLHLMNPHASLWGFLNTALVGVLLSLAYLRTRSLWLPWGIHFGWNATLGLLLGLPVSGLNEFSVIVRSRTDGPTWLTGGSYGLEASVTAAVVIVVGIVVLLAWVPRCRAVVSAPEVPSDTDPPNR